MKLRTAVLVYGIPLTILAISLRHGSKPGGASLSTARAMATASTQAAAGRGGITARLERELHPSGDAWLAGEIDLTKLRLVASQNRYEAPLSGGRTAILTLDPKLQQRADAVIADANAPYAAIVVLSTDGRLLAISARSQAEPGKGIEELALRPWAPAASVFKIVTSAALISAGVAPDADDVCYHGGVHAIDETNLTDQSYDATCNSLAFGVAASQNAIVGKLAVKRLTAAKLRAEALLFGIGGPAPTFALGVAPSKLDLPDDATPLELARAAAGFWHTQLSPLGGALLAETIATGGLQVVPRIVAGVLDPDGSVTPIRAIAPVRAIDQKVAAEVAKMMVGATEHGTAYKAFHDGKGRRLLGDVIVAGKTGTLSDSVEYSWFVGYGPVAKPSIVVAVLLGNSATWKMKAHVAARRVLEAAFQK